MKTEHILYIGDSKDVLSSLTGESIGLVITSPPYWNIKDYGCKDQIGFNQSYEEYLFFLKNVWLECKRVLLPGCKLVINVGDQFLRAKDNGGIYEIKPIHADIIKNCQEIGFRFLGNIIWRKITNTKQQAAAPGWAAFIIPVMATLLTSMNTL